MTPAQCRMARAALNIGVRDLAVMADVSTNTITRLEKADQPSNEPTSVIKSRTVSAIRAALEAAGIQFMDEGDTAKGLGVGFAG